MERQQTGCERTHQPGEANSSDEHALTAHDVRSRRGKEVGGTNSEIQEDSRDHVFILANQSADVKPECSANRVSTVPPPARPVRTSSG